MTSSRNAVLYSPPSAPVHLFPSFPGKRMKTRITRHSSRASCQTPYSTSCQSLDASLRQDCDNHDSTTTPTLFSMPPSVEIHTRHRLPHLPLDTVLRRACYIDPPIPPSSQLRPPLRLRRLQSTAFVGLQLRQVESPLKMDRRGSAGLGHTSLLPPMPRRPRI
ncbi:hypothetical protein B0H17DRAFT_10364 [Mycena rosella]|uniref:Uncharacterized protein n=1 Tax=Mycena rosella TaxID=1033263 RepID=A0AAD7GSL5_MYCRO|nr:hypothetical protein B0H17DRAFT_10364 [Mycena rosella]